MKIIKQFINLICLISLLILPYFVFAANDDALGRLKTVGTNSGFSASTDSTSMAKIVATSIYTLLTLLGIIFVVLIIYAGYNWMTANGEEAKVTKAKDTITRAVIGLVIILAAYSITYFVFSSLDSVAGGVGGSGGGGTVGGS